VDVFTTETKDSRIKYYTIFLHYQPNHIYESSYKPRDYAN